MGMTDDQARPVHGIGPPWDLSGGRQPGRIGARRRPVGWLADFVIAAVRVHHDPPGFPAVPFLVAAPAGQRVADDPGEAERQGRPGQHEHPEYPGDHVEVQVQVVGDLVIGCRGSRRSASGTSRRAPQPAASRQGRRGPEVVGLRTSSRRGR